MKSDSDPSEVKSTGANSASYEKGLKTRREVLGDEWVDRSLSNKSDFNAEFQELITRYAWDEIWNRPGLDRKMRRVMVLSVTMTLGRWEEFELHVRSALSAKDSTGLSPEEMKEVLMQNAIYAGVPAANTSFKLAERILKEVTTAR